MKKILCEITILLYGSAFCFSQIKKEQIIPLDSVFILAERNSTHLKLSESAIDIKKAAVDAARKDRLPTVDMNLAARYYGDATIWDRDFSNKINAEVPDFGNDFGLQASYVIFAGGAVKTSIEKLELEVQVANLSHEKNSIAIRFLVAGNYLDLYKLYNQKKVFENNIVQTNEVIRQVKVKLQAGMALDNDLTRYELMLQNLNLALIEIENNISIVNQHLVITLGLSDEIVIIPDSSVQLLGMQPILDNDFYGKAIENRSEIKIQELNKTIAQKDIKLAKADLYPSVAVIGADYLNGPILVEVPTIDKNLNYWYVGVCINYKISSLWKIKNNIKVAEGALTNANLAYEVEIEQAKTSINTAYIKYSEAYEKLETYKKSFELASQNYLVINNRYQNDLVLITEMLDASNMKLKAELQVINAKLDVVYQYFNLLRETGTL